MKKIMILGAGVYQIPIIEEAKKRGLYTIVVSPKGNYPGIVLADKVYDLDVRDEAAILEVARRETIDGITTDQTDLAIRSVAYVAEKMGLPGINYECAKLFTNKSLMREKCLQLGLPTIKSQAVCSLREAKTFFSELNAKAIIKPVDSQGSRGVSKIHNIEDLEKKYEEAERFSRNGSVIIEQFIDGTEFEVNSIVVAGKSETLTYADLVMFQLPDVFASTMRLYPSLEDRKIIEKLLRLNKATIEGFGLWQGLTHSEFIMNEFGEIYLLEAAARGGGAFVSSHIAQLQTGLNTSGFLLDIALENISKIPEFQRNQGHSGDIAFYLPEGQVVSVEGISAVTKMPFIHKHLLEEIKVGMHVDAFSDKTSRYIVILQADSREELMQRIDLIKQTLKIQVQTAHGIEGPIWG